MRERQKRIADTFVRVLLFSFRDRFYLFCVTPPRAPTAPFSDNNAQLLESINADGLDARMVLEIAAKMKRISDERTETEPLNKKTKSEKIDM